MSELLDTKIEIKGKCSGTIKYVGQVEGKNGKWIGIILDKPIGSNNGSYKGKSYFTCAPNYGLFMRIEKKNNDTVNNGIKLNGISIGSEEAPFCGLNPNDSIGLLSNKNFQIYKNDKYSIDQNNNFQINSKAEKDDLYKNTLLGDTNDYNPNQSLFFEDMYTSKATKNFEYNKGTTIDKSTIIEEQNKILREQAEHYKELFYAVTERSIDSLSFIKDNLSKFDRKINKLHKINVTHSEREQVIKLVSEIYKEDKLGNNKKVNALYDIFKKIMSKYNIKID